MTKSRKRTSVVWTIDKNKLQEIFDTSESIVQVLKTLGFSGYAGNHRTIKKRLVVGDICLKQFELNKIKYRKSFMSNLKEGNKIPLSNMLVKDSSCDRGSLKRRLIKENLLKYQCSICNNDGDWQNQKLSLQLDHINGVSNDNRLKNLRFLCPNCHSQTETFSGKRHKVNKQCKDCGNQIHHKSTRCPSCASKKNSPKKLTITKKELYKLIYIDKIPFTKIGKMFEVSDNTIRNYAKRFKIL